MDLTYTEATLQVDRAALRYIALFVGLALLHAFLALEISAPVVDVARLNALNMLFVALQTLGPMLDRWRVSAKERDSLSASSPRVYFPMAINCERSRFNILWCAAVGIILAIFGTGLLVDYQHRLTATQYLTERGYYLSIRTIWIFSIAMWLAQPVILWWFRDRNRLILDREGLHLPGRALSFTWSDIAHVRLRQSHVSIMIRLTLVGDAAIANQHRAAKRFFNPAALDDNEVLLTISGLDKSAATILDYIRAARSGPLHLDLER